MMKLKSFIILFFAALSLLSCGKKAEEYTEEMPPSESVQAIDTVDHSSANVKDPVFEQKN